MKKYISLLFAAILLTACAKEIVNGNADAPVFKAVMESGNKVHLDEDLNGRWDKDDMVTIFLGTIANQQYKFNGATGDENGTFTMVGTPSFATSGLAANYAVYPYNPSTSISDAGVISCTFPEAQNYAPGSYGIGANTMVAVTESTSDLLLMFKNACGYLRVSLYGDASITSISLQGNNGEKIAGAGTITAACDAAPVVAMDSTATGLITLDCGTGVALGTTKETATTFYFVIPPVEFANGLTIRATDTEGKVFEKSTSKAITIARNTILKMAALEYQGVPAADTPSGELSFYAEEASSIALNKVGSPDDITLEYLVKGAKWTSYTIGETITLAAGDSVCFRAGEGGNATFSKDYGVGYQFSMTGMIRASGNIMSLLDTQMELTSVPMYSFNGLFSGCSSLTTAPELPATSMYTACYSGMFKGCTGLSIAPKLPATILKDYCYHEMFRGCTGLTNAPDLPATNLADYCYAGMFRFCSGLTSAPELPSSTLAQYCYSSMFRSCTGLTSAPELPAITLVDGCYTSMFVGCSGLNYVKMLATDVSATSCMANWLNGVASTGTFVKNSDAQWDITGPSGVPEGWTVVFEPKLVDLGLSVKWATCNLGATDPWEYGDYYAWGATEPWYEAGYAQEDPQEHWKTGKSGGYIWSNTPYQTANTTSSSETKWTKYLGSTTSPYKDASATDVDALKTVLDPVDDAARVKLGSSWRIPTEEEWTELWDNCSSKWTAINGVKGYKLQSEKPGYTDNWIFLPAAGSREDVSMAYKTVAGGYWSSSLDADKPAQAWSVLFTMISYNGKSSVNRSGGASIRPVCD